MLLNKQKIHNLTLSISIALAGLLMYATSLHAEPLVTATYQVVAIQPTAEGSLLTVDVTIVNSGTVALNALVLNDIDPTQNVPAKNSLVVGDLAIGAQSTSLWSLTNTIPADQVTSSLPLYLQAQAVDANNGAIAVTVEGVAK